MTQDLKKRIPVAIMYVAVIVSAMWFGSISATVLMLVFLGFSLTEFVTITDREMNRSHERILSYSLCLILSFLAIILSAYHTFWYILLAVSLLFICLNGAMVLLKTKVVYIGIPMWLGALLYLGLPFAVLIWRISSSMNFPHLILAAFVLIWVNDAGAYFIGKVFGKNPLHIRISPSKTVEGFIGGGIFTLLAGLAIYNYTGAYTFALWSAFTILIFVFAVLGDLSESTWKRYHGIKDTGTILSGHGGFLDRLDSFIYAIPVIVLISLFL